MLSQLQLYSKSLLKIMPSKFALNHFHLLALQLAIRSTSTTCMGSVFPHNKGNCCQNMDLLYQRMFILCAIACPSFALNVDEVKVCNGMYNLK